MGGRKLSDIAKALSATVAGDGAVEVLRLVHPADAEGAGDLAIALTKEALGALAGTKAKAVVVPIGTPVPASVSAIAYGGNERVAVAILTALFDCGPSHSPGVHPTAVVAPDAIIAKDASIGAHSIIGARTRIGTGAMILPNVTIGAGVTLGRDCLIHPGVRIGDRVEIGDRVVIAANAVIGADGFSFIPVTNPDGKSNGVPMPLRTHSLGTVVIGDDVEIGAGTTIDRATLRQTRIGRGTKIDNQVQIAHNVIIGENCLICGLAGIAGSAVIGDRVVIASAVGVADHVTIGDGATIAATSGVATKVPAGAIYSGTPAVPHAQSQERYVNTGRLKTLYPRVEDLKNRVEALEKGLKAR
jgi:UDP-3-O-[3-hydroxymyristoyl] glucosamine N-acyltransferase